MQQHIKDLEAEILERDNSIDLLKKELETEKDNNARAPTTTMKNMVERLKGQLSLKEKQHQVGDKFCFIMMNGMEKIFFLCL